MPYCNNNKRRKYLLFLTFDKQITVYSKHIKVLQKMWANFLIKM